MENDVEPQSEGNQEAKPAEAQKPETPMIPKTRLDQEIQKRKEAELRLEEFERQQKQAADAALEEQGKFKDLYDAERAKAQKLEDEMKQMVFDSKRKEIAAAAGFPALWNRLQGDDEEALRADMNSLIESIPTKAVPNIDAGTGSGSRPGEAGKPNKRTSYEKQLLAGVLNLNPDTVPDYPSQEFLS